MNTKFTEQDLTLVKKGYAINTISELNQLVKQKSIIKLDFVENNGYTDYNLLFNEFEKDYNNTPISIENQPISFFKFLQELDKGYTGSDIIEISRLIKLSDGFYYDNEWC